LQKKSKKKTDKSDVDKEPEKEEEKKTEKKTDKKVRQLVNIVCRCNGRLLPNDNGWDSWITGTEARSKMLYYQLAKILNLAVHIRYK